MLDILVVDDEAEIRLGVAGELEEVGHHVTEAADGAHALRLISEHVFDVVTCDVRLPHVDGLAVLEELQRRAPDTAVILMTAYGRIADATAALRAGAYDYVTKPFDVEEFPVKVV